MQVQTSAQYCHIEMVLTLNGGKCLYFSTENKLVRTGFFSTLVLFFVADLCGVFRNTFRIFSSDA